MGDINQAIPRQAAPRDKYAELNAALASFEIWTRGTVRGLAKFPVCHIMGSAHFDLNAVVGHSRELHGKNVSDHDGLSVELRCKAG